VAQPLGRRLDLAAVEVVALEHDVGRELLAGKAACMRS